MKQVFLIISICLAWPALAETLVPVRTIRAKEILTATDVTVKPERVPGAISNIDDLIGKEARVALYAGRPIQLKDVGAPAIVDRNDIVTLVFDNGLLSISTEGRALGRGAAGDSIRVMNLGSRSTLTGRIREDGAIEVQ